MRISDCYICNEPVKEGTLWGVDVNKGFTCEKCEKGNPFSDENYRNNAAFLKNASTNTLFSKRS